MNEIEKQILIKKLLHKSKNRGCRENNLILRAFAERFLFDMELQYLEEYAMILEQNDADIYDWITHKTSPPKHLNNTVIQLLLEFNINNNDKFLHTAFC